jgi:hypothetical protein
MIAANYRKHPEALALQLPLPWGHRLTWHTERPGSRLLRTLRAARSHAFQLAGRIAYPIKQAIPQWWKDQKKRARSLANAIKSACLVLIAEIRIAINTAETELLGFNYENNLAHQADEPVSPNKYRAAILARRAEKERASICPGCGFKGAGPDPDNARLHRYWLRCGNCTASWNPAYRDQAAADLAADGDDDQADD